jgi:flagellar basal-body rod protein FlgG
MIDAIGIATTGLSANQQWINSISNNVANMQTHGYKRTTQAFFDLVAPSQQLGQVAESKGLGVRAAEPLVLMTDGQIKQTGAPLDIAIQGNGFFEVENSQGQILYTRVGHFALNDNGQLILPTGEVLNSNVRVPKDVKNLKIDAAGQVSATVINTEETLDLGQIDLNYFNNPELLQSIGSGLYKETTSSGEADLALSDGRPISRMLQGQLELSNVDIVQEMTSLVMAQRAYQMNARLLQASDQIMETVNNLRR